MAIFIQPGKTTQDRRTVISADAAGDYGTTLLGTAGIAAAAEIAIDSYFKNSFLIPVPDETTDITTGVAKTTFRIPYPLTISDIRASVNTAPTGVSGIIIDVNKNGSSILSTKLSIDPTEETSITAGIQPVISDNVLESDDEVTIDIDQIGSTNACKGVKVLFTYINE